MKKVIDFEEQPWLGSSKDWVKPSSYKIMIDGQFAGWLCEHFDGNPTYWFEIYGDIYSGQCEPKDCPFGIRSYVTTRFNEIIRGEER